MEVTLLILVAIAVIITGISKGGFSGAFGIIAVPLISLKTSPVVAAAIMLPILCIMDVFTVQKFWKKWDTNVVKMAIPAAIAGIVIGTLTATWVSDALLKIVVGLVAIGFCLNAWRRKKTPKQHSKIHQLSNYFWCALGGFTSFIAHAGGPPMSVFLLRLKLDKTQYVACAAIIFSAINYVKLIPYYYLGQLNFDLLMDSLLFAPLAFLGVQLGGWLHYRLNNALFFNIMYVFLAITGLKLIFDGSGGLF